MNKALPLRFFFSLLPSANHIQYSHTTRKRERGERKKREERKRKERGERKKEKRKRKERGERKANWRDATWRKKKNQPSYLLSPPWAAAA